MDEKIIRIIIADDHAFLREGIKKTIQDEIDMLKTKDVRFPAIKH